MFRKIILKSNCYFFQKICLRRNCFNNSLNFQIMKPIIIFFFLSIIFANVVAQPPEQLEKQRMEIKKELEKTQSLLNKNKALTSENLLQWRLISKKVNLQGKVVENINNDLKNLNNNIYLIQKDINRYDRILDTLKAEYAKSMVYAYKNRSNYEFLNFIFSAESFNDAIKRIAYLKSYRNFREKQGENILRTQEQRKKRIADLNSAKSKKGETLKVQNQELATLATEQKEKDRIISELKKQGKDLNKQIAAKNSQLKKVNNAIAAAIKKAQEEARKQALAKAAAEEKKRLEEERKAAAAGTTVKAEVKKPAKSQPESVLLNAENIELNNSFTKNKGSLPWPVDRGTVILHYGNNKLPSGDASIFTEGISIAADVGTSVKSVFNGTVSRIVNIDGMYVLVLQHGRYFTTYSNLSNVSVETGQNVTTGQVLGKVATGIYGNGAIDFYISDEKHGYDPETWLRK